MNQIFNTTINSGTVQNLALGSHGAHQSAINGIQAGDVSSLLKAFGELGVPTDQIRSLDAALKEDQASGESGLGARVKEWLADFVLKTGEKVADKGIDSMVSLAARALSIYFALPSVT